MCFHIHSLGLSNSNLILACHADLQEVLRRSAGANIGSYSQRSSLELSDDLDNIHVQEDRYTTTQPHENDRCRSSEHESRSLISVSGCRLARPSFLAASPVTDIAKLACYDLDFTTVELLLREEFLIDASLDRRWTSDLSTVMTAWSNPKDRSGRLQLMELLASEGSCPSHTYKGLIRQWIEDTYDLPNAVEVYRIASKSLNPLGLLQLGRGRDLLDIFRHFL